MIKLIYRHNPHGNEQYGNEIILFHSDERYKKRVWRFNTIESLKNLTLKHKAYKYKSVCALKSKISRASENQRFSMPAKLRFAVQETYGFLQRQKFIEFLTVFGAFTIFDCDALKSKILIAPKIHEFLENALHFLTPENHGFSRISSENGKVNGELELKVIVGEFSEDTQEIIKHAVNHGFGLITIIGGPKVFCEDRTEIYTLLDRYENIKYFVLPTRPNKHFMIFSGRHLYIEKPHRHNESRGSVGVKNSNPELINIYNHAFTRILKHARQLTKEEVLNHNCYKN